MQNQDDKKPLHETEELQKPLAPYTSWHIGGSADRFYSPQQIADLSLYLAALPEQVPLIWLGLGSNVLIRDGGIKGAVICTLDLKEIYQENGMMVAQAGVPCAKLARQSCQLGFEEAAFFAGIPGTVGGALAMNAGAFGGQTWDWVHQVMVINRRGETQMRSPSDYEIGYREVKGRLPEQATEAFVGAIFQFKNQSQEGPGKIKELLRKRSQSQPIGTFNCGSVYRNPPGDHAARLIEASGLKGFRIGNAMVSEKHANFIINVGQARAKDVEALMAHIEATVFEKFGIKLQAEVKILGQEE